MSLSTTRNNQDDNGEVSAEVAATSPLTSPAHRFTRYTYDESRGVWLPPHTANLSEILHGVVVAGRPYMTSQPLFDMQKQTPFAYSVYDRIEQEYQQRTGHFAHTCHSLTTDEYIKILNELCIVIDNDPCDREWMVY